MRRNMSARDPGRSVWANVRPNKVRSAPCAVPKLRKPDKRTLTRWSTWIEERRRRKDLPGCALIAKNFALPGVTSHEKLRDYAEASGSYEAVNRRREDGKFARVRFIGYG